MNSEGIIVTPKKIWAYTLILIGLGLIAYVAIQCLLLASGMLYPLVIHFEYSEYGYGILLGIILQLGTYALLITTSAVLMGIGVKLSKA